MGATLDQIKELRDKTSAGILDCKKALEATDGDLEAAKQFLREKGLAASAKREDREASQGVVSLVVDGNVGFELHVEPVEYPETHCFYVMVGVEILDPIGLPLELSVKVLPAGTYAIFTLRGPEITSDWPDLIYKGWLPDSGHGCWSISAPSFSTGIRSALLTPSASDRAPATKIDE